MKVEVWSGEKMKGMKNEAWRNGLKLGREEHEICLLQAGARRKKPNAQRDKLTWGISLPGWRGCKTPSPRCWQAVHKLASGRLVPSASKPAVGSGKFSWQGI